MTEDMNINLLELHLGMRSKNETNDKDGFLISASGKAVLFNEKHLGRDTDFRSKKESALFEEVSSEILVRR